MFEILKELKNSEKEAKKIIEEANIKSEKSIKNAHETGVSNLENLDFVFNRQKEVKLEETKIEMDKKIKEIEELGKKNIEDLKKKATTKKKDIIIDIKKIILD